MIWPPLGTWGSSPCVSGGREPDRRRTRRCREGNCAVTTRPPPAASACPVVLSRRWSDSLNPASAWNGEQRNKNKQTCERGHPIILPPRHGKVNPGTWRHPQLLLALWGRCPWSTRWQQKIRRCWTPQTLCLAERQSGSCLRMCGHPWRTVRPGNVNVDWIWQQHFKRITFKSGENGWNLTWPPFWLGRPRCPDVYLRGRQRRRGRCC